MERFELQPGYWISRVIKGGWHLAGGHGDISEEKALKDMLHFVEAGITTFDCADIYTGVEVLIGKFLKKHADAFKSGNLAPVQIHTKYVPDYNSLATLTKVATEKIIDRSLRRLGVERLDLVQFGVVGLSISKICRDGAALVRIAKSRKDPPSGNYKF